MSELELRICARYKLQEKIGGSSYAQVYRAINCQNNLESAIKMEQIRSKHPQVLYEGKIMQNLQGGTGIPSMYWCGQEGEFNFLVMELLDQSLAQLQEKCGGKFSLRCVLNIILQILRNIEYIHFKQHIHRDLKPENFMIGRGKRANNFFTIDFGLSKRYVDLSTHQHIPWKDKKPLIGTARYASINAHKGCELSRRDDLESLAYMFIFMLKGSLPWQGIQARTKDEKHIKVRQMKVNLPEEDICDGLPSEFATFLKYARNLKFEENPDYIYIKNLFTNLMDKHNYLPDQVYDWYFIEAQADDISKNDLNNYTKFLPFNLELFQGEEEFIKSLNLEQYEQEETMQKAYLDFPTPLNEIKLTQTERERRMNQDIKKEIDWKQQQQQCVKFLKEQQFLVNERDMNLTQRSIQTSAIQSHQTITNDPSPHSQGQYSKYSKQNYQLNQEEDMSVTQRGDKKPNYGLAFSKKNGSLTPQNNTPSSSSMSQKSNHQKKKSGCYIF